MLYRKELFCSRGIGSLQTKLVPVVIRCGDLRHCVMFVYIRCLEPNRRLARVGKEQEILAELRRLIEEQFRSLQGRLSEADSVQCARRAERIRQLFDQLKADNTDTR